MWQQSAIAYSRLQYHMTHQKSFYHADVLLKKRIINAD